MTFLEKQTDPTTPMHWRGNMQADYLYTNGVAGDRLFKHIQNHDSFLANKCPQCMKVFFPPRLFCEDCFCDIPEDCWLETPLTGIIQLYTVVTIDTYGNKLEKPQVIAMITIDKTDSMIFGMIHTDNADEELLNVPVKAVLKPKNEREGNLKDILYFEKTG